MVCVQVTVTRTHVRVWSYNATQYAVVEPVVIAHEVRHCALPSLPALIVSRRIQ
jgi:hypothetical protein